MRLTDPPCVLHKITRSVLFLILIVLLSLTKTTLGQDPEPRNPQPQRQIELVPPGQEKQLHMLVRPQIPLKFKVNNLNSRKWAHDLQVEVTNTSGRPIYFLHFFVTLPEVMTL